MKIVVLKERGVDERRVAAVPETVKKLIGAGHTLVIEPGAGLAAGFPDSAYEEAGASISDAELGSADLVAGVRRPSSETLAKVKEGAGVIGLLEPHSIKESLGDYNARKLLALSMEYTPRITRAQSMDALSSQSNLAGYRAVIEAAELYGRAMPMMMTAAGTVAPAKTFVMGAGVAGLQAIATARRLGAIVSATDVRPAAKEQEVNSSRLRTKSSKRLKLLVAMPSRCLRNIRRSRLNSRPATLPSRTLSSPRL